MSTRSQMAMRSMSPASWSTLRRPASIPATAPARCRPTASRRRRSPKSTGEVMGIDVDFGRAFAKSQLGSGTELPLKGCVFVSVRDQDKDAVVEACRQLVSWGFDLVATRGTAKKLEEEGVPVAVVNKVQEGRPDIVDKMRSGGVQLVFNTTEGAQAIADSFSLRRTALTHSIPYYTTVAGARAAVQAIGALRQGCLEVAPLQTYLSSPVSLSR